MRVRVPLTERFGPRRNDPTPALQHSRVVLYTPALHINESPCTMHNTTQRISPQLHHVSTKGRGPGR